MTGVKGWKQLPRSPEDINLGGDRMAGEACLIKHGITVARVCVCLCDLNTQLEHSEDSISPRQKVQWFLDN